MSVSFLKGKLKSSPNMPLFQCPAVTLLAAIWLKWLMNRRRIIHPLRSQPLGEWSDGPESIDFLSIPYIYDISHTFPCNSAWPLSSHSDPWNPSSDHPNLMDPTSWASEVCIDGFSLSSQTGLLDPPGQVFSQLRSSHGHVHLLGPSTKGTE